MLWRTKDDYDKNRGMIIRGDIVANETKQTSLVSLQSTLKVTKVRY
jgi:hypothetical protein